LETVSWVAAPKEIPEPLSQSSGSPVIRGLLGIRGLSESRETQVLCLLKIMLLVDKQETCK
jgi:hypothetical protein